jgi:CRISPR system Cascade subunit CasB
MKGKFVLTGEEKGTLQHWHRWLDDNRGDRAKLRRAERAEDVLLTDAFFNFHQMMPEIWRKKNPIFSSAAVAGLLSHIKNDRQFPSKGWQPKDKEKPRRSASFAEQLATPLEGKKPPVSELRFQQLQKSRSTDDFYLRLIRVIRLLNGKVSIISLASDILHWHREFNYQLARNPANRLAVLWATDYFTVLPKANNK